MLVLFSFEFNHSEGEIHGLDNLQIKTREIMSNMFNWKEKNAKCYNPRVIDYSRFIVLAKKL